MPGIGVINNPRSRQNRKNPERMARIGYMLGQGGESRQTWTLDALREVIEEFRQNEIDILAINGGDGSNHVTLTTLIEVYGATPLPKITFLRGGTLNTTSDALGIKGSTEWLIYNLSEKYSQGLEFDTCQRNILKIGNHYGFIFGNGIIANFLDSYYATGSPSPSQGVKTLVRGVASALTGGALAKGWFKKIHAELVVDGEVVPLKPYTALIGASIHEIGVGFTVLPRCETEPGKYHILALDCEPLTFPRDLPY